MKMKKKLLAIMVFLSLFLQAVLLPVWTYADQNACAVYESVGKESGIIYTMDQEENVLGISDFAVDGKRGYLLSNVSNKILVYEDNKRVEEIDLERYASTAIRFAVDGNRIWIYDNCARIFLLENLKKTAELSIYDFADSEAIEDFKVIDGDLYITIATFTEKGEVTYRISLSGHNLSCTETIPGRLVQKEYVQDLKETENILHSVTKETAEKDGYQLEMLQGCSDLGEGRDHCHYYLSCEILDDKTSEYYVQRVYCFTEDNHLKEVYNLPIPVSARSERVRMIDGRIYILSTEENRVVLDELERYGSRELSECLLKINWSRSNPEESGLSGDPNEAESELLSASTSLSRSTAISIIDSYCTPFTWSCSAANLLPLANWICPSYVTGAGTYNCMPYCWGGFCDAASFASQIQSGYRVGNKNGPSFGYYSGYVNYTAGIDCSGLVSRALMLSDHCYTGNMAGIMTSIHWNNLKQGDIILNPGTHVMMYYYTLTPVSNGYFRIFESTIANNLDRCVKRVRNIYDLSGYSPYTYPGYTD